MRCGRQQQSACVRIPVRIFHSVNGSTYPGIDQRRADRVRVRISARNQIITIKTIYGARTIRRRSRCRFVVGCAHAQLFQIQIGAHVGRAAIIKSAPKTAVPAPPKNAPNTAIRVHTSNACTFAHSRTFISALSVGRARLTDGIKPFARRERAHTVKTQPCARANIARTRTRTHAH